ncbi:metal ABC transporter ATP-binding protein [Paenibacillus thalictri]|uniref:Metal ABC transporter ATP-binding protein n=1 Tax=Paenibacillus thalictri TaxID=2527873 RepID=A0A4Q9DU92_9BACL|nr:metal ABC transporter ATP-binding protein [Paenibacillus thalictri]TBL79916.1 metal ABC transporter ATP-binding protein [Paenibacillus thalictri]
MNGKNAGCHQSVVSIDGVFFFYEQKKVIDDLCFDILERDFVGLVGSNGAGKTTLLRMMVGLLKPSQGQIKLFGEPVGGFRDWDLVGYVPQKNSLNPLFPATVKEVVLSGLYGKKKMFRRLTKADYQKCEDAMRSMSIEDLADRRIGQLSGGQQQRVFLARALINNPRLLILDEPTVGIDARTQADFFQLIRHMHQHHHITFVMVTHDLDMLQSYLGNEPVQACGGLKFFVKHTHEPEDCLETNLTHSLQL